MPKIEIVGENILTGEIKVSGAKNSVVALIPAAILCDEKVEITNVPNISDTKTMIEILKEIGCKVIRL